MNSDRAKSVIPYITKLKVKTYNELSEILATLNEHIYDKLQSNNLIDDIIKECYEKFG